MAGDFAALSGLRAPDFPIPQQPQPQRQKQQQKQLIVMV